MKLTNENERADEDQRSEGDGIEQTLPVVSKHIYNLERTRRGS